MIGRHGTATVGLGESPRRARGRRYGADERRPAARRPPAPASRRAASAVARREGGADHARRGSRRRGRTAGSAGRSGARAPPPACCWWRRPRRAPTPYAGQAERRRPPRSGASATHRDRDRDRRAARRAAGRRCRAAARQPLGDHRADAGQQHHHQQQQRQLELGEVPAVGERRQPGGQADEDQPLGGEGERDGHAGPREPAAGVRRMARIVAVTAPWPVREDLPGQSMRRPATVRHSGATVARTGQQLRRRTANAMARGARRLARSEGGTGREPGFGDRLRYLFDNSMSRGTPALIAWLTVATAAADPASSRSS